MTTSEPTTFRVLREAPEESGQRWPLALVTVALLALGLVPLAESREISGMQREIDEVLEPARQHALDLALIHARQIARFQSYLMTGDPQALARYEEARDAEQASYDALVALAGRMDLDVQNKLAALYAASSAWHVLHAPALSTPRGRQAYLSDLAPEQQRNDALLAASRDLTEAILRSAAAGRERVARARTYQLWFRVAVVAAALLAAAAAIWWIGRRLRALVSEAQEQRGAAVRARRAVDAILDATGDGVLVLDGWGRCTSINRAGARLLGREPADLEGRDVHEVLHGDDGGAGHAPADCPVRAALAPAPGARETQDLFRRADGSTMPVQWTLGPLEHGLKVKGAVLTFSDLSETHEAQQALQQAVRARDEVVAVVSHDLRNPLGTIAAAAGLLLELDLPPDDRTEHLQIIVRASERMERLMRDLLDIARIESGGLAVEPEPVAPAALVAEALDLLRPLAVERELELSSAVEPGLPAVRADRDRILQVLSNLVGNALKFTREGGVRIEAARGAEGQVVFAVRDSGSGISHEGLAHVFDRFWQQSRADRRGAGLGLAIVQGIVRAHGGRVDVESRPGQGSCFRFTLPVEPAAAPASFLPAPPARAEPPARTARVPAR